MMRVVDLFSGCGGLTLGFQNAGFDVVAAFDNWDAAVLVYEKNFHHPVIKMNLAEVETSVEAIKDFAPEMIIGGPPCQDFSSAGKRNEDNGKGDLTTAYAKIIAQVKPEWLLMENVDRILKTNKLKEAKSIFAAAGYGLSETILDASLCGVPQKRKRYVLIGKLNEKDGFFDYYLAKNLAKKELTVADYFGDDLDIKHYYRHPRSYARRGVFSICEPSPTIRGVNRPIPKGYTKHSGDSVATLENLRPLTTEERSRIQTFPKNFQFFGTKTNVEQMIGNAVPVNLAKYVADGILEFIKNPRLIPSDIQWQLFDMETLHADQEFAPRIT